MSIVEASSLSGSELLSNQGWKPTNLSLPNRASISSSDGAARQWEPPFEADPAWEKVFNIICEKYREARDLVGPRHEDQPTPVTIDQTLEQLRVLCRENASYPPTAVMPDVFGSVRVEWRQGDHLIAMTVDADGDAWLAFSHRGVQTRPPQDLPRR